MTANKNLFTVKKLGVKRLICFQMTDIEKTWQSTLITLFVNLAITLHNCFITYLLQAEIWRILTANENRRQKSVTRDQCIEVKDGVHCLLF